MVNMYDQNIQKKIKNEIWSLSVVFVWTVYANDWFIFIVPDVHLILSAYILSAPKRQYKHNKTLSQQYLCIHTFRVHTTETQNFRTMVQYLLGADIYPIKWNNKIDTSHANTKGN